MTIESVDQLTKALEEHPELIKDQIASVLRSAVADVAPELIEAQVAKMLARTPVDKGQRLPVGMTKSGQLAIAHSDRAPGIKLDGQFKGGFGEFLTAVVGTLNGQKDERLAIAKALGESDGGSGGFLLPEEFRADLLALAIEGAIVRPRAMVIPMGQASVRVPAVRDVSHAQNVFGGVQGYWTGEAAAVTPSQPTFTQMQLIAKKLTGFTITANELLQDSAIGLETMLNSMFGRAIRYFEEDAFFSGVGTAQPAGFLNSDCRVTVDAETLQDPTTVVYKNLVNMYSRMLPSSVTNAVWLCNPNVFPELATMALNVGTGGGAVWITNVVGQTVAQTPPATIFGRPVLFTEHCQSLGTEGDIVFADFSYFIIGDRQELTVAASIHDRFTTDETTWRFIERLDARPWLESALTPRHGNKTLSPFVTLASR